MQHFDVQAVEIDAAPASVFAFVRQPRNLSKWARAFASADERRARLRTPAGTVDIELETVANEAAGTVDWRMTFPDRAIGIAQSRVTETVRGTCIYSFVLHAPPVPLEQLEGALEEQKKTLGTELADLKKLVETR